MRLPQRDTRPERQSYAIVWRVERDEALIVPIVAITGRPAEGDMKRYAAHRSEIVLAAADIRALGLPLRRAIVRVDRMRRVRLAALAQVSEVGAVLMGRINTAVERELAAQRAEAIRLSDAIGKSSFRFAQGALRAHYQEALHRAKAGAQ